MKRYMHSFLILCCSSLLLLSCGEKYLGVEQVGIETTKPEKLTVDQVIPKSGALEIHFTLPSGNPNIDQVVATYLNKRGQKVEFKVSRYSDVILVEGFVGTDEATVELTCVDVGGHQSDVTLVKAAPLASPAELAMQAMKVEPAFGGVKVSWENKDAQALAIHVLTEDVLQVGTISFVEDPLKTIYNRDSVNTFAYVRQYPSAEQRFGFVISDKWGNRTDTLVQTLTPYKEEEIDYNRVKAVSFFNPTYFAGSRDYGIYGVNAATGIQNDANAHGTAYAPQTLFNSSTTGNQYYGYKFVKNLADPNPANREIVNDVFLTFDLNMDVRLSRYLLFPRTGSAYTYGRSSPKRIRIYGTDDSNKDRWAKFPEGWVLIGEYVGPEPAVAGSLTQEEIEWFNSKQEYSISEDNVNPDANPTAVIRYMRLHLMDSYNRNEAFYTINEFKMFGDIQKTY